MTSTETVTAVMLIWKAFIKEMRPSIQLGFPHANILWKWPAYLRARAPWWNQ